MTRITWIIIVLIMLSILVTLTEVFLRFAILAAQGKGKKEGGEAVGGLVMKGVMGIMGMAKAKTKGEL